MRKNLLMITVILLLLSCKKDKLRDEKFILMGKWGWTHTVHEYGWCDGETLEDTLTPESEFSKYSVELRETGKIIFYNDGEEINKYRIVFDYFKSKNANSYLFAIDLDNDENKRIGGQVSEESLILVSFPFDPIEGCEIYGNYFVRE